jgi:hypothetical protein
LYLTCSQWSAIPVCSYYLIVPLSVLPASAYPALLANIKASLHSWGYGRPAVQPPSFDWVLQHVSWLQLAGAIVFLAGNLLQWHSHWLLARLSRRSRRPGYKIPKGEPQVDVANLQGAGKAGQCWHIKLLMLAGAVRCLLECRRSV